MRLVFMGTPEYAAIHLEALVKAGYEVAGVFAQPDRPKGRGGKLAVPPAKQVALEHGIPVFQPERIRKDGVDSLRGLKPDVCVTAAFGQILSEEILAVPPLGTVNVHASLLPAYRGSSPVNWAIIKGEKETGVTTMMTNAGIDTGDILLQKKLAILPEETAGELTLRLAHEGAELLIETLRRLQQGTCPRQPQDEARMSYYPLLTRDSGRMDWTLPADELANLVRGTQPWPGASSLSPWGTLKVLSARALLEEHGGNPGDILEADEKKGLLVKAGKGSLRILRLQAPGGKPMDSTDFLRGHPLTGPAQMVTNEVEA